MHVSIQRIGRWEPWIPQKYAWQAHIFDMLLPAVRLIPDSPNDTNEQTRDWNPKFFFEGVVDTLELSRNDSS